MSQIFNQFQILMDFADNYKQNLNIYFFIKNFAFMRAFKILSQDEQSSTENEKGYFEQLMMEYKNEKTSVKHTHVMSKEEYIQFLEEFFEKIDFDNANTYILTVCKSITEILGIFGELEELWQRRSKLSLF